MNEIITDIKVLQKETLLNLQSSKANNTIRAYNSDFNDFIYALLHFAYPINILDNNGGISVLLDCHSNRTYPVQ